MISVSLVAGRFVRFSATLLIVLAAGTALAQDGRNLWSDIAASDAPVLTAPTALADYRLLHLDFEGIEALLAEAPRQAIPEDLSVGRLLSLPLPDGTFAAYRVVESSVMAPGLQARYPSIRTYLGQDVDTPRNSIRLSVTPQGFHAMGFRDEGTFYIEPAAQHDLNRKVSYWRGALPARDPRLHPPDEVITPDDELYRHVDEFIRESGDEGGSRFANGSILRVYRTAVAANRFYTAFHSSGDPNVEETLAAIVVALNRVNQIYERDIAVRLVLVDRNDEIIYTSSEDDPYSNSPNTAILATNQANLDTVIGSANYDLGHVFITGGGGIATLFSVCSPTAKARGVTGLPQPTGDPFFVDYVSHEFGHQFGARHTFNGSQGGCGPNRSATTAFEPGSGSTIMAYSGLCGADNIQVSADDYFHNISLTEMIQFITNGGGATCGEVVELGNPIPSLLVSSGPQIPILTPFRLTTGVEYEGDPADLTFVWEGMTLGPAGPPPGRPGWDDSPPYFRTLSPVASSTRFFPRPDRLVLNASTLGEGLPASQRQLRFRVTARTNTPGGGAVADRQIFVPVNEDAGPFVVTSQNSITEWVGGETVTITWDVANTNTTSLGGETVDIFLSRDRADDILSGDHIVLAQGVPNNGAAEVIVPDGITTTRARIFVLATTGYFFSTNTANIIITPGEVSGEPGPDREVAMLSPIFPNPVGMAGGRATVNLTVRSSQTVRVLVYDALGREVMRLHDGPLASGINHQLDISARGLAAGTYYVRAVGESFSEVRPMVVVH